MKSEQLKLYLVTDRPLALGRDMEWIVSEAVKGGVTMVQLREKEADTREFVDLAQRLKKLLAPLGVPLIINDRIDVALAVDADGVHIGQSDMPYETVRRLLGPAKIIGLSVENMEEVLEANSLDVDYIGVSPVYATATKTDTAKPFGLEGLREAVKLSKHPAVAIGGMNAGTAAAVMACGPDGIAVVSAIVSADSPREASRELLTLVDGSGACCAAGDCSAAGTCAGEDDGSANVACAAGATVVQAAASSDTCASGSESPARATAPKWSEEAWEKALPIYRRIIDHPFLTEMAAGTLDNSKFERYLAQDEVYLGNYGRAMSDLADIIPDATQQEMFRAFAKEGMESERLMHELLIDRFGIDVEVSPSVVTSTYNEHTRAAVATGCKELGLAAILPCAWVYNAVGHATLDIAKMEGNPYREWMAEYANEEFDKGVRLLIDLADEWAAQAPQEVRDSMTRAFVEATLFEYAFWDYGYCGDSKSYSYMTDPTAL
ncbi:MAG: thiamine phosphate synthase [Bacteroidales bacterium]|nr:thiamine phosphate synthase [Bacteroidales bacterium]